MEGIMDSKSARNTPLRLTRVFRLMIMSQHYHEDFFSFSLILATNLPTTWNCTCLCAKVKTILIIGILLEMEREVAQTTLRQAQGERY